jgi:hypothetical protein
VPVIGLSSSDHPASTETTIYVSAGAKASDSNDGLTTGTPKATIGSAKSALGSSPGTIVLLNGSWTVGTTDGHGNVLTLDNPGQWIRGQGINNTTVTVTTNATWLVRAAAAGCGAEGINWIIPTGVTVTHGVGVSPLVDPQSAHDCAFRELIIGVDGTLTNAYTLGPDFPGSSTQDIASTLFDHCTYLVGAGALTNGFLAGNGTTGNVLANVAINCGGGGAAHAVAIAGGGLNFIAANVSGCTVSDIQITHGAGQILSFNGRFEGGKRLLDVGYVGPVYGVELNGIFAGGYTPTDHIIGQFNAEGPLRVSGGYYDAGPAGKWVIDSAGVPTNVTSFAARDVGMSTTTAGAAWPVYNPMSYLRIIQGAQYTVGSALEPDPQFQDVNDGARERDQQIKAVNYQLLVDDDIVIMNGASLTATLPDPSTVPQGRTYTVKNYNASALTVNSAASGTLDSASSQSLAQWAKATYTTIGSGIWLTI